ncbi:hypothetical protein F4810DRAFT_673438 [Camillea tinctor]|nr:hypothetical protein F4810DRAFT_673438 [Camillea tinctor]
MPFWPESPPRLPDLEIHDPILNDLFPGGLGVSTYHGDPIISHSSLIEALRTALRSCRFGTARILLSVNHAPDLLEGETDILQLAISSHCVQHPRWSVDDQELTDILMSLITHGASVNSLDAQERSPLYHACASGYTRVFNLLAYSGADCMAVFDPLPNCDVDSDISRPKSDDLTITSEKIQRVSLLDIALEAFIQREKDCSQFRSWTTPLELRWGDVIMFLIKRGLAFHTKDPRLAKFIQVACYQGNLPCVEELLVLGVDQSARPARGDTGEEVFGSCLHAAVAGGQQAVVECLMRHGTVASAKRLCTQGFGRSKPLKLMTPIEKAFVNRSRNLPVVHDALSCAGLLVQAGASEDDCRILLEHSIVQGNTGLALTLINKGIRLRQVPQTENLQLIKLLLDKGTGLDFPSYQRYAVSKGNVELLQFLVGRAGPLLQSQDFRSIAFDIMRGKGPRFMDMLRYLVTDYRHDANATFRSHPNADYRDDFLLRACEESNVSAVIFLLEHGADPAIAFIEKRGGGYDGMISKFSQREMPVLKALFQHSDSEVQSNIAKRIRQHKSQPYADYSLKPADFTVDRPLKRGETYEGRLISSQALVEYPISDDFNEATPWVEETASRFQYTPLETDNSIRLLILEPSISLEDPIRCRLVETPLSENPQYETLSCAWRNMSKPNITPISLNGKTCDVPSEVWDALRRVRLSDRDRYIWTDAICINQGYVGEEQDRDEQGSLPDDWVVRERNQHVSRFHKIYRGASQLLVWLGRTENRSNLVFEHLARCRDHKHLNWCRYVGETELAYRKLCQRPWFYDVWTAQKLAQSRKTVIMCGSYECQWPELTQCSCFFPDTDYYHPLEGVDGRTHLYYLRAFSWGNVVSLRQAVLFSRRCKAEDHRDKAFGIMGLGIDRRLRAPVDYRASAVQVFCEFTQRAIIISKDLEILHFFGPQRHIDGALSGLPSWVPNFNMPDLVGVLPGITGLRNFSVHYPRQLLPGFRFPSLHSIAIMGRPVEKVELLGEELVASATSRAGSARFNLVLKNWEHLAAELKDTKKFSQSITDAFSDTLVGNDEHDLVVESDTPPFIRRTRPGLSAKADGFDLWYAKYGTKTLKEADPDYFEEVSTIKAWIEVGRGVVSAHEEIEKGIWERRLLRSYKRKTEMTCYGRKFFTTDRGSIGLAPPQTQPGDEIIFFPGGKYPFILRATDEGAYKMVGDCFLYDLDVFALFQNEEIETKEYVIV